MGRVGAGVSWRRVGCGCSETVGPTDDDRAGHGANKICGAGQGVPIQRDTWSLTDIGKPGQGPEEQIISDVA